MTRSALAVLAGAAMLVFVGCKDTDDDAKGGAPLSQAATDSIDALDSVWMAGVNGHDMSAVGKVYAQNAVALPPNMPRVVGRDSIQALFNSMADSAVSIQLVSDDVHGAGDYAFRTGNYTISAQNNVVEQGKFLSVFQRTPDEGWKMIYDMWSPDSAPATAPAAGPATPPRR